MDILVTKRLTLRSPLEVDAEAICAALQNPNVTRMLTSIPQPYAVSDALDWIKRTVGDEAAMHFSIYREKFLGVVSVELNESGQMDLGYWLDQSAWGQGFMSEAARATVSHAFRTLNMSEIHSGAYEDNPASMAVLQKLGFHKSDEKSHFNPTRRCDVTCNNVVLMRNQFETIFGSLETNIAA